MHPSIRFLIASELALLALALFAGTAFAQGDKAAAEALFREGKRLMDEGHYDEACPMLAESQRIDPGGGNMLNLALCHEKQGKSASAWGEFKEALSTARADHRNDRIDFAQEHIAQLEPQLSYLQVSIPSPVAGLTVEIDGATLGSASWGVSLPIDPGEHRVTAQAQGFKGWESMLTVAPVADRAQIIVPALEAVPVAAPPTAPFAAPRPDRKSEPHPRQEGANTQRIAGFAIGAIGIAGMIVGGGFGVNAIVKDNDADELCDETTCPDADSLSNSNAARKSATAANILLASGAGLVAAGLIVVLTAPGEPEEQETARGLVSLGPDGAFAGMEVAW